jgi:hypothetical protein
MSPETVQLVDNVADVYSRMAAFLRSIDSSNAEPQDLITVWESQLNQLQFVLDSAHD